MKIPMNERIKNALNRATSLVFDMDDAGIAVLDIEIDSERPVITVDREPPGASPAYQITTPGGRNRKTIQVAALRDCRVQWLKPESMRSIA